MIRPIRILSLLALAALLGGAVAQETGIRVNGTGTVFGAPDRALVTLGVDVGNEDPAAALRQASEAMDLVLAAVGEQGVADEDVRTVAFSVFRDERFGPEGMPVASTFRVFHQVQITLRDTASLGDLLSVAVAAGANSVGGIEFALADPQALEAEAREQAMADAFARAEALAESAGVELGAPIAVSEVGGFGGGPIAERAMLQDAAFSVPIASGQLAVSVTVSVLFAIGE